jgi:3D (Asp-Asp-Asp) domain-containing protein
MAQMPQILRFTLISVLGIFSVSCAQQVKVTAKASKPARVSKVRTTAYTHTETGGGRNAIGKRLCGKNVMSAASDWSRFPLGTKFRINDTNEQFVIDDYGGALIGTSTIDLYKPTRLAMQKWGVRHVDIDVVEWGSDDDSLKVLAPRRRNARVQKMIAAIEQKKRTISTITSF